MEDQEKLTHMRNEKVLEHCTLSAYIWEGSGYVYSSY